MDHMCMFQRRVTAPAPFAGAFSYAQLARVGRS
jgi:hypothetical protein